MKIYDDTFNRSTSGSLGTASGGWSWTEASHKFECDGSQAQASSGASPVAFCPALDTNDHSLALDLIIQGTSWAFFFVRSDSTGANCYKFGYISGALRIWRTVSGGDTMIANRYDGPTTGTVSLVCRVRGTDASEVIQMYVDGVLMHEVTADGGVDTGTRCGIGTDWGGSAGATHEFDNFHARDFAAQAAFPTTNLVSHYPGDESSGSLVDVVGGHDMAAHGSPTSRTISGAPWRDFNGSTQYFDVADTVDHDLGATWTVHMEVYFDAVGTNIYTLFDKYDGSTTGPILCTDRLYVNSATENSQYADPTPSTPHSYSFVYDSTQSTDAERCKVYVDGVRMKQTYAGTLGSVTGNTASSCIGRQQFTTNRYLDGAARRISIYKGTALTVDQVIDLYNAGSGLAYPVASKSFLPLKRYPLRSSLLRR